MGKSKQEIALHKPSIEKVGSDFEGESGLIFYIEVTRGAVLIRKIETQFKIEFEGKILQLRVSIFLEICG